MRESLKVNGAIMAVSAVLWSVAIILHDALVAASAPMPLFGLVFIPAGIRMMCLLIGGVWAAAGVTFASLFLVGRQLGLESQAEIVMFAACCGFAPYVALLAGMRLLKVGARLRALSARHLPLLSLAAAAGSALLQTLLEVAAGHARAAQMPARVLAMTIGEFLGSLCVVLAAVLLLRLVRRTAAAH